ncbi:chromosome partitioning protein ParA [Rhodospirillum rubrum]|uniref:Partition protein n=1 Tax=Rhodospirillum rubrum (strain ATCC 11170 / ATH 1.1.1 / DSM 467 / LMG 4362 / NCIMB 8255 / S1) TaxID=269796 RepID=Q2RMP8_RHORT|nr:AAA family ATPase [Rhodospirillum rubrum]ABC24597.1 putative partition protein [Rhodospirillum rubrum ATCC 11170]MBK1664092.1 chromosome partitioning protein ParA [Rhodospirillum rubrum]MBK1676065.1 chromosome partitioning protein ParA [Rhodospirillum rubrum]QXG82515.1 AAA family ATPase [Rhodospirillum rubrum]
MILTVGNTKGGVGKTTLAVNLAVERFLAGKDVLLIDADNQRTSSAFSALRESLHGQTGYTCIELSGSAVHQQGRNLAPKYDEVIIDVGGRDTSALRGALAISDIALVPFAVGTFDIWAAEDIGRLIEEARGFNPTLRAFSVLNMADPAGGDNADAAGLLTETSALVYLRASLVRRKAMRNAAAAGLGVLEMTGSSRDSKACGEVGYLAELLYNKLN